jgi:hypothetical protein
MTARVVIYSTLTARPDYTPRRHAESPECPGVPICGTNLRNWTRAVAVDDRGLCAACWPAVSESAVA